MTLAHYGLAMAVGLLALGAILVLSPGKPPRVRMPDPLPPGSDATGEWKAWSDKLRSEEGRS